MKAKSRHLVPVGRRFNLGKLDPDDTGALRESGKTKDRLKALSEEIGRLETVLYAEARRKILIVLQGMDTSGKDGTIRKVFSDVNPAGVRVAPFKAPNEEELSRDFLWRIHKHVPGSGEMVIFNRSHYEDVLVPRVKGLVPKPVWKRRYDQINDFERMLAETGTTLLKFFLHIDHDEQKKRLKARLKDPKKLWKYNPNDLKESRRWKDYMAAYEDLLSLTSTEEAPWHAIPANQKWYRNLAIAEIIVEALKGLKMRYPTSNPRR